MVTGSPHSASNGRLKAPLSSDFASNQPDTVLPFNYDDSTFGSIGAEYKLSDTVTLRGGVAYDETPTSYSHRDVRVPEREGRAVLATPSCAQRATGRVRTRPFMAPRTRPGTARRSARAR